MTGILLGVALLAGAAIGEPAVIAVAGLCFICVMARGRSARWTAALIVVALVGAVRVHYLPETYVPEWVDGTIAMTGKVVSGPVEAGNAQGFEVAVQSDDPEQTGSARLCAKSPVLPELGYGDTVWFSGKVTLIVDLNRSDSGYIKSRGCVGQLDIQLLQLREKGNGVRAHLDHLRRRLTTSLQAAGPGDTGALMAGLVTGDDFALSYQKRQAFITTGTSHITAVSGSNLAVIITLFAFAGQATRRGKSTWWQLMVLLVLWGYVAVIGFSPPPTRAAVVATLAFGAVKVGRRPDFITLSLMAAAFQLIVRPADFNSLAFRLSTISAIALVMGLSLRPPGGWRGWLTHAIVATAVTQAATSVLLIPIFGRFQLYAIPANMVVGPLCSIAFPIAFLAGLMGIESQTLADAASAPAILPTALTLKTVSFVSTFPFADKGDEIAALLPDLGWMILGFSILIALSREFKGGVVRLAGEIAAYDTRMMTIVVSSALGATLGLLLGLWLR